MQRSMPIVTTKVAVISGLLLLGLLAVAVWLLASASPASALTDDTTDAPQSAAAEPVPTQRPTSYVRDPSEWRAGDVSSGGGDPGAPPSGVPSPVAVQGSVVSSSAGRDFGQGMLLFAVMAAGIVFVLGGGRRLWREATGWFP